MLHLIAEAALTKDWQTPAWALLLIMGGVCGNAAWNVVLSLLKTVRKSDIGALHESIKSVERTVGNIDAKVDRNHSTVTSEIASLHAEDAKIRLELEQRVLPLEYAAGVRKAGKLGRGSAEGGGGA